MQPASGVPGDCFQLGKATIIEEEPDIPEIDDGGKFRGKLFFDKFDLIFHEFSEA